MCFLHGETRLQFKNERHLEENTMHPDIAYQLADHRRAELIAEAAHQRLVREAKQAGGGRGGRHQTTRRWWWALQPRHT
jgi:hypothetical protein